MGVKLDDAVLDCLTGLWTIGSIQCCTDPDRRESNFDPSTRRTDRGLVDLVQRAASDIGEYLAALKARPIAAERVDLKKLPTDWQSLKPYSAVPVSVPRRIGNGRR